MAKDKTMYVCDNCGYESVKWLGKCPACNRWDTMKEIKVAPHSPLGGANRLSPSTLKGPGESAKLLRDIEAAMNRAWIWVTAS